MRQTDEKKVSLLKSGGNGRESYTVISSDSGVITCFDERLRQLLKEDLTGKTISYLFDEATQKEITEAAKAGEKWSFDRVVRGKKFSVQSRPDPPYISLELKAADLSEKKDAVLFDKPLFDYWLRQIKSFLDSSLTDASKDIFKENVTAQSVRKSVYSFYRVFNNIVENVLLENGSIEREAACCDLEELCIGVKDKLSDFYSFTNASVSVKRRTTDGRRELAFCEIDEAQVEKAIIILYSHMAGFGGMKERTACVDLMTSADNAKESDEEFFLSAFDSEKEIRDGQEGLILAKNLIQENHGDVFTLWGKDEIVVSLRFPLLDTDDRPTSFRSPKSRFKMGKDMTKIELSGILPKDAF